MVDRLIFLGFCGLFLLLPVATSPAVVVGVVPIAAWLLSGRFLKDRRWLHQSWTWPVILLTIIPWAGLLYAGDHTTGMIFAKKTYYWLYAFIIAGVAARYHKHFVRSFLAGLSFSVVVAMLQYAGFVSMRRGVVTAFMGGGSPYITYSLFLVLGMLLLSYYFGNARSWKTRALCAFGMAAYLLNLAVIPGRSGYLAFVVLSPVMLYQMFGRKRLIWIAIGAVALMAVLFSSTTVRDRASLALDEIHAYYDNGVVTTSVGTRLYMYDGAWKIFLEHPIIGAGTGGYEIEMAKRATSPEMSRLAHPHNSFLFMMASYGLVGLGAFIWMLVVFIRSAWRARAGLAGFAALAFALVFLVGGATDTEFLTLGTGMMVAMFVGMDRSATEGHEQPGIKQA